MASKWFSNKSLKVSLPYRRCRKLSPPVSPTAMHDYQAFRHLDRDGDGKISSEELREFFVSMGEDMSQDEAKGVIIGLDSDGDELLDFGDFMRLMECDDDNDLKRAFELFEVDKGSGCITPNGLQRMLNCLGDPKSYEECAAMIRVFDLDGDGVVNFHEFKLMMT